MIYNNAVDQIKSLKPADNVPFRLAKVSSLSSGRAYVQFYGESSASGKLYPYIEGYKPTVNDDVLLVQQGSTFIIIGKVSKTNIVDNYNLTKTVADTLYMPAGTSLETDHLTSGSNTLTLDSKTVKPSASGTFALGTSSRTFKEAYIDLLNGDFIGKWYYAASSYNLAWSGNAKILPSTTDHISLGDSSKEFDNVYAKTLYGAHIGSIGYSSSYYIRWGLLNNTTPQFYPNSSNKINLGSSSNQFNNCYAKQFYQNGTAISTSDRRKKTNIKDIAKKYIDFFKRLKPRSFRFKDGESGRTHTGFIAQEVEEAAAESGINNKDLAFICIDEEGNYGLRYEELIAIQTQVIQDLMARVERLENIVKERA